MEHSKLPWVYCGQERENPEVCDCMQIWSKIDNHPIAKVECGKWGDEYPSLRFTKDSSSILPKIEPYMDILEYGFISTKTAEANAAFIVKAVNCHDELLEACKDCLCFIQELSDRGIVSDWSGEKDLINVIAKAEEK